jgi:hypothetical protein
MFEVGLELLSGLEIYESSMISFHFTFYFILDISIWILNNIPITVNSLSNMSEFVFLVQHH